MLTDLLLIMAVTVVHGEDTIHEGEHGYSTYYEGNGPLIIMSHHNGPLTPTLIPDRHAGCWDNQQQECIWTHNCHPQDSSNCGITTVTDQYTKELAQCIYDNVEITNNNNDHFQSHLIINEIRRTKLDSNRQIGEAAQGNNRAQQTWKEIHEIWANQAKQINLNNCGFAGLLIDIHGQSNNEYINLGYRLPRSVINLDDFQLNDDYLNDISIKSSIVDNTATIGDAIRGYYSLGSILNDYGYDVIPSLRDPTVPPSVGTYFAGATVSTLYNHGSQNSESSTDAIQIEVNRDLRFDEQLREKFCIDFSDAIVQYLQHWYNLDECRIDDGNFNSKQQSGATSDEQGRIGFLYISLIGIAIVFVLSVVVIVWKYFKNHNVGKKTNYIELTTQ